MTEARQKGLYASIRYDKLIIEDQIYKYDKATETVVCMGTRQKGKGKVGARVERGQTAGINKTIKVRTVSKGNELRIHINGKVKAK